MTATPKPLIVTPGDPDGIGPEIVWNSIRTRSRWDSRSGPSLVCVGAYAPFKKIGARVEVIDELALLQSSILSAMSKNRDRVWLIEAPTRDVRGKSRCLPGFQSGWSIERAVRIIQSGAASGLVTGPISKDRLQRGGYAFPGHTEFLAKLTRTPQVTMMLANSLLRVTMVTTHVALNRVSSSLTSKKIETTINQTIAGLTELYGIRNPRVAVAALNPHAGEGGLFGKEETRLIEPALRRCRARWRNIATLVGPTPADTLFAQNAMAPAKDRFDAIVCMYHDQGLIPVKLVDFPHTVNLTLGLPILRTSVDHGTAFDLVGTHRADPRSFQSAVVLAKKLVSVRSSEISTARKKRKVS